jgi:hypothetical protein
MESQCRYTLRLLKRLGYYETEVAKYFQANATPPSSRDVPTTGFLRSLSKHEDPLVASVAKFELASLEGDESVKRSRIVWDRNPESVIKALDESTDLPPAEEGHSYSMDLARPVLACELRCAALLSGSSLS